MPWHLISTRARAKPDCASPAPHLARRTARPRPLRGCAQPWPKPLARPLRLQVVDCDAALCRSLSAYLREAGLQVNVAHTSQAALQHMRRALPDVLLVDPSVPDSQALVAACRSDPRLERVPLVVLSADARLSQTTAELGARAGLAKPIDLDVLLAVLKAAARRSPSGMRR